MYRAAFLRAHLDPTLPGRMSLYELESMMRSLPKLDGKKADRPMDGDTFERLKQRAREVMPGEVKF